MFGSQAFLLVAFIIQAEKAKVNSEKPNFTIYLQSRGNSRFCSQIIQKISPICTLTGWVERVNI